MDYSMTEKPEWRKNEKTTSELLQEISCFKSRYDELKVKDSLFAEEKFARAMAVEYVVNSNLGELVGTQTEDDTLKVLEEFWDNSVQGDNLSNKSRTETLNTYKAMEYLHKTVAKEMGGTGLLTVQLICDTHKILLEGLHREKGEIRQRDVWTRYNGNIHFYPDPVVAQQRFYGLIDRHNTYIAQLSKFSEQDKIEYVFKCAAQLLFEFVDAHPFYDGNGRMCRLLANHTISQISPFPVSIYHGHNCPNSRCTRSDYIDAIVRCRENPNDGPGDLAAMLVEGAWIGWKNLCCNLERRRNDSQIGPIVVQKKDIKIKEKIEQIWSSFQKKGIEKAIIIAEVSKAVVDSNVEDLKSFQCLEQKLMIQGIEILLQIYP